MKDPTKSSLDRCRHGVYTVDTPEGMDNSSCSCCTPIKIGVKENPKTLLIKVDGEWENLAKK